MSEDGKPANHDYSAYDADRRSSGFRLAPEQRAELQKISRRIATTHNIQDREAHLTLVFELWRIMGTESRTYIEGAEIKVAADAATLKSATEDIFPELDKCLQRAVEILHGAAGNEAFLAILLDAARDGNDPADQISGLFGLAETVAKAREFKGTAGRRRRPDWVAEFCQACQCFWHEHGAGGTKLNFKAPTPPAIALWVEDLFKALRDYRMKVDSSFDGLGTSSPSAMKKLAQELPAFRPNKKGENGV